jgi:hypothetical protein
MSALSGDLYQTVYEEVRGIDFTAKDFPINTELYTDELDMRYKGAF